MTLCDAYLNISLTFAIRHKGKAWPLKLCFKEQNGGLTGFLRKKLRKRSQVWEELPSSVKRQTDPRLRKCRAILTSIMTRRCIHSSLSTRIMQLKHKQNCYSSHLAIVCAHFVNSAFPSSVNSTFLRSSNLFIRLERRSWRTVKETNK